LRETIFDWDQAQLARKLGLHDDHISRIENGRRDYRVTPRHMASLTRLQPPPGREADHARLLAELDAAVRAESAEVKASRRARRNKGPDAQPVSPPEIPDPTKATVEPTHVTPAPAQPPLPTPPAILVPTPAQPTPAAQPTVAVQPPTVQPTSIAPAPVETVAPGQATAVPPAAARPRAGRFDSGTGVRRARRFVRRYGAVLAVLAVPLIVGLCVTNAALLRMAGQAIENNGALTRLLATSMTMQAGLIDQLRQSGALPEPNVPISVSLGDKGRQKGPLKIPPQPYSWQKPGPCNPDAGEREIRGGCYVELSNTAPCPSLTFEEAGKCYRPIERRAPPPQSEVP
jgi:transcriptional regulator with XRE-family HTH domain